MASRLQIVLPQRVAFEAFPQHYSLHVGVSEETDSHQVPDLPLLEIGPPPQVIDRRQAEFIAAVQAGFDDGRVPFIHRCQVVDDFKMVDVVDARDGVQKVEIQPRVRLHEARDIGDDDTIAIIDRNIASYDTGALIDFSLGVAITDLDDLFAASSVVAGGDMKVTIVPVPAAIVLGLIGFGTLAGVRRRLA